MANDEGGGGSKWKVELRIDGDASSSAVEESHASVEQSEPGSAPARRSPRIFSGSPGESAESIMSSPSKGRKQLMPLPKSTPPTSFRKRKSLMPLPHSKHGEHFPSPSGAAGATGQSFDDRDQNSGRRFSTESNLSSDSRRSHTSSRRSSSRVQPLPQTSQRHRQQKQQDSIENLDEFQQARLQGGSGAAGDRNDGEILSSGAIAAALAKSGLLPAAAADTAHDDDSGFDDAPPPHVLVTETEGSRKSLREPGDGSGRSLRGTRDGSFKGTSSSHSRLGELPSDLFDQDVSHRGRERSISSGGWHGSGKMVSRSSWGDLPDLDRPSSIPDFGAANKSALGPGSPNHEHKSLWREGVLGNGSGELGSPNQRSETASPAQRLVKSRQVGSSRSPLGRPMGSPLSQALAHQVVRSPNSGGGVSPKSVGLKRGNSRNAKQSSPLMTPARQARRSSIVRQLMEVEDLDRLSSPNSVEAMKNSWVASHESRRNSRRGSVVSNASSRDLLHESFLINQSRRGSLLDLAKDLANSLECPTDLEQPPNLKPDMEGSGDDEHDEDVLEGEVTDGKVEMVMSEEAGSALDNTAQSPILKSKRRKSTVRLLLPDIDLASNNEQDQSEKAKINRGQSDGSIYANSSPKDVDYNRAQSEKVMSAKARKSYVNVNLDLQLSPSVDQALISRLSNNKSRSALRRGSLEHQITRQQIARARWVHATWWALQEVQRVKAEKAEQKAREQQGRSRRASTSFVAQRNMSFRRSISHANVIEGKNALSKKSTTTGEGRETSPIALRKVSSWSANKFKENLERSVKGLSNPFGTSSPITTLRSSPLAQRKGGKDSATSSSTNKDSPLTISEEGHTVVRGNGRKEGGEDGEGLLGWLRDFIEGRFSFFASLFISLWLLVLRDLYFAIFEKGPGDVVALSISLICLVAIITEILMWSMAYPRAYMLSFHFGLDIIATIYLFPDAIRLGHLTDMVPESNIFQVFCLNIARASHAAPAGGRLLKVLQALWQSNKWWWRLQQVRRVAHDSSVVDGVDGQGSTHKRPWEQQTSSATTTTTTWANRPSDRDGAGGRRSGTSSPNLRSPNLSPQRLKVSASVGIPLISATEDFSHTSNILGNTEGTRRRLSSIGNLNYNNVVNYSGSQPSTTLSEVSQKPQSSIDMIDVSQKPQSSIDMIDSSQKPRSSIDMIDSSQKLQSSIDEDRVILSSTQSRGSRTRNHPPHVQIQAPPPWVNNAGVAPTGKSPARRVGNGRVPPPHPITTSATHGPGSVTIKDDHHANLSSPGADPPFSLTSSEASIQADQSDNSGHALTPTIKRLAGAGIVPKSILSPGKRRASLVTSDGGNGSVMSGTHRSLLGGRLASTQSQAHGPGGFKEKEDSTTDGERKQSQQEGEVDEETDIWFHLESWVSGNQVTVVFLLIIVTTLIQPSFNGSAPESKKFLSQTTANVVHNLLFEQRVEPSSIRCGADGPMGSNLLFVRAGNETICGSDSHDLRIYPAEIIEARAGTAGGADDVLVRFDMRSYERQELIRVVILSITVVLVLGGGAMAIAKVLKRDVVSPVQRMLKIISSFATDPLKPLSLVSTDKDKKSGSDNKPLRETEILQNALVKFGSLLQVGFGEAGAEMISASLRGNTSIAQINGVGVASRTFGGNFNTGKVIQGFFGYCDIRSFTDLTEVLQADVVKVVNACAKQVHSSVDATFGAPNKNIGDAFLVVWKCKGGQSVRAVADGALRATVRNVLTVSRSAELAKIAQRKTVQDRLPGYTVRLGYSLHYGWAVECAIGSDLKVDTSYLSPHVSLASRLEEATKRYGVDILMTSHTWGLLSPYIQEQCRRITRVIVKGTPVPFELFTYDVPVESSTDAVSTEFVTSSEVTGPQFFTALSPSTSVAFRAYFSDAVALYLGGPDGSEADWPTAVKLFKMALQLKPGDGPCIALLEIIAVEQGPQMAAPSTWKGYHAL